ncbi:MAG: glutamine--fructose-6-phosphate transaminase (isomerizing) [Treponema sp.]|nr:glutamine--fructose-6-phosphate transaminase (isomerizing) [Treponema sp.]
MCGIVGYVGNELATPILIDSLKKLEYRGYDSAGIAVLDGENIIVRKSKGALKVLQERIANETIKGSIGIGHTRWATHGEPSDLNAHPQTNVSGTIAVVHNGIIENHSQLKQWLQSQGTVFKSQTDTEVVAHLINFFYSQTGDIFSAVMDALAKLEGSYALGVLCKNFPDRIIAARNESPLVVGLGKGENFIASDVPALLSHTREVYFLEQKEIAVVYSDHVDLFSTEGERHIREPYHVEWDASSAEKEGYAHFMLKEIHEQPKAILDTMRPRLIKEGGAQGENPIDIKFEELEKQIDWKNVGRIVITACGTASYAGQVAKYAFEKFARLSIEVDIASEYRYRNPIMNANDIFIVISQSGETADTLAALRLVKKAGAKIIAITNCVGSSVSREADYVIYTWAGAEISVASTKAYTAQLVCLYMLALKAGAERKTISQSEYENALLEFESVPQKIEDILKNESVVQKLASQNFNKASVFYIGRRFDSASCLEAALKLKEVSYMHSEAFAAGELKHGPIALIDKDSLVVAIASDVELYDKIHSNIEQVKSRGAQTLVITQDDSGYFSDTADDIIAIPKISAAFAPLLTVIPAQLFAYYCAVLRGNDPDKPRNLAKSVTVE